MSLTVEIADGVCRCRLPGGRFLSTGFDGGVRAADAAFNVTVPEGWGDAGVRDLRSYVDERVNDAGFTGYTDAPALLTGVVQRHARMATLNGVTVVTTVGISNPAALPVSGGMDAESGDADTEATDESTTSDEHPPPGTVNLIVGTDRSLAPGALANLVAVVAEAKAATLLPTTGFPGTTSDAVVVACDPSGPAASYSGSSTRVGTAARACVRDGILASLASRYDTDGDGDETGDVLPATVQDAKYGVETDCQAKVTVPHR